MKEASAVLGIHERRVTQALDPALEKVARLMRADPLKTLDSIREAMADLEPMSERELDLRERLLSGRADRCESGQDTRITR